MNVRKAIIDKTSYHPAAFTIYGLFTITSVSVFSKFIQGDFLHHGMFLMVLLRILLKHQDKKRPADTISTGYGRLLYCPILIYFTWFLTDVPLRMSLLGRARLRSPNRVNVDIRKCKVCGKYFLAESLKYELCSEKCRKEQGKIKKRELDARAVENSYDRTYKNECQRWRNIIHRAEKSEDTSPETLSKTKSAFEDFKAEALKRKTTVKEGQSSPKEFEDWILVQSSILYKI